MPKYLKVLLALALCASAFPFVASHLHRFAATSRAAANSVRPATEQNVVWSETEKGQPAHYINYPQVGDELTTACGKVEAGPSRHIETIERAVAEGRKPCPDCILAMQTYITPAYWEEHEPRK